MKMMLKDGDREATLEADDALLDCNPWYRESVQKQMTHLSTVFYTQEKKEQAS